MAMVVASTSSAAFRLIFYSFVVQGFIGWTFSYILAKFEGRKWFYSWQKIAIVSYGTLSVSQPSQKLDIVTIAEVGFGQNHHKSWILSLPSVRLDIVAVSESSQKLDIVTVSQPSQKLDINTVSEPS